MRPSMFPFSGIIPTRVGTSISALNPIAFIGDHPHACGDKRVSIFLFHQTPGSSPRVWGQDVLLKPYKKTCGIIPTRVGTRSVAYLVGGRERDHPHACGDKRLLVRSDFLSLGSSPCVWGQVYNITAKENHVRIIPTHVGTRRIFTKLPQVVEDHPHACGDKVVHRKAKSGREGSSPRMWGQGLR